RRDGGIAHDRLAHVDGDDVGALMRQPDGVAAALTARRSGDESDFALNTSSHGYPISSMAQPITAGMVSQPRTVEVGDSLHSERSISHSGKRFKISSSAMRPSRRASAEPRH